MEKLRPRMAFFFLLFPLLHQSLDLCASLSDEARVTVDPFGALSHWAGMEYSNDGRVVSLTTKYSSVRKFLREISKQKSNHHHHHHNHSTASPAPSPLPSPSPSPSPSPLPSPSLSPSASPSSKPSHDPTKSHSEPVRLPLQKQKDHATHIIVIFSVAAGLSFVIALSVLYLICCRGKTVVTVMPWRTGLSGQLQKALVTGVPSLKRSELESACEDFSNIVGSLSDCFLYKGTLSTGVEIAVTSSMVSSAKDWSDQYKTQFRNKISVLSKVNHKNFMNLIGYSEEEKPFTRMMVYEYAPNGTLFEHLHIKEADQLDWASRLRIIMGVAYCLDHMHQLNPPVVLSTLASSSIYLCEDNAAKLSDLSLNNENKPDPYNSESQLPPTQKDNVYKFGIIMLEIISGRLPFSQNDGLLVLWASSYLNGTRPIKDMVDSTLESFDEEKLVAMCEVVKSCIEMDLEKRATMEEVVGRLREITGISPEAARPRLSPLWWAELEIISTEGNSLQ